MVNDVIRYVLTRQAMYV